MKNKQKSTVVPREIKATSFDEVIKKREQEMAYFESLDKEEKTKYLETQEKRQAEIDKILRQLQGNSGLVQVEVVK